MSSTLEIVSDAETAANVAETRLENGQASETCPTCGGGQVADFLAAPDRFHWRKKMWRLEGCSLCSGVWLASPPAPVEMGQHYTEDYHKAIVAAGEGSAASRWKDQV